MRHTRVLGAGIPTNAHLTFLRSHFQPSPKSTHLYFTYVGLTALGWIFLRLSMDFVQPTCRPYYNKTTRNGAYAHPLNFFSLSLLWILWHTVNVPFLSPHLYYGRVYRILLKIEHLFRLLNLLSKHSCFGNLTFDLFYFMRNCILINYFFYFIYLLLLEIFYRI